MRGLGISLYHSNIEEMFKEQDLEDFVSGVPAAEVGYLYSFKNYPIAIVSELPGYIRSYLNSSSVLRLIEVAPDGRGHFEVKFSSENYHKGDHVEFEMFLLKPFDFKDFIPFDYNKIITSEKERGDVFLSAGVSETNPEMVLAQSFSTGEIKEIHYSELSEGIDYRNEFRRHVPIFKGGIGLVSSKIKVTEKMAEIFNVPLNSFLKGFDYQFNLSGEILVALGTDEKQELFPLSEVEFVRFDSLF